MNKTAWFWRCVLAFAGVLYLLVGFYLTVVFFESGTVPGASAGILSAIVVAGVGYIAVMRIRELQIW